MDGRDVPEDVSEQGLWQMNSARLKLGGDTSDCSEECEADLWSFCVVEGPVHVKSSCGACLGSRKNCLSSRQWYPPSSRASLPPWRYEEEDAVEHITPLWVRFKFKPQLVVQILSMQTVFCLIFQLGNTFRVSYYRFGPNLHSANLRQFTLTATEILQADLRIIRSREALLSFLAKKCCL